MKIGDLIEWTWCVGPGDQWETFSGMIAAKRTVVRPRPGGLSSSVLNLLDVLESTGKVIEIRADDARVI